MHIGSQIIGIAGHAGAGKGTIAKWFGDVHQAFEDSFAFPIKQTLIGMFPQWLTWKHFEDRDLKEAAIPELGRSPRELAQLLGTEFGRRAHSDLWVIMLAERMKRYFPHGRTTPYVIADLRFDNEADWIRANGGIVIHVERPEFDGNVGVRGHASEAGLTAEVEDYYFCNKGTIDDLRFDLAQTFPAAPSA